MGLSKDKVESDDMLFVRKEGTDHCGRSCAPDRFIFCRWHIVSRLTALHIEWIGLVEIIWHPNCYMAAINSFRSQGSFRRQGHVLLSHEWLRVRKSSHVKRDHHSSPRTVVCASVLSSTMASQSEPTQAQDKKKDEEKPLTNGVKKDEEEELVRTR